MLWLVPMMGISCPFLMTEENQLHSYLTAEINKSTQRPRVLWEVYCGHGRTSQLAEALGMEVRVFSYEIGWGFNDPLHRGQFLQLLQHEMPDELLAPECKLCGQNINSRDDFQRERLRYLREHHHKTHLTFVRRAYLVQVHGGQHAHNLKEHFPGRLVPSAIYQDTGLASTSADME